MTTLPLVDVSWQQRQVADEVRAGFDRVLERGDFIMGGDVMAFEEEFARYSGTRHCVTVANGTDALALTLSAMGVSRNDEVVVPSNSFIASAAAVVRAGAVPVFADVDEGSLLLTPESLGPALTARTRAVMVVHLFGRYADMSSLHRFVGGQRIMLIEDAAQAQGARSAGSPLAAYSVAAATSFYPGKNLGAYGDGGAVLTNDNDVAAMVRMLGDHGSRSKYDHEVVGHNSRLDTLQAVVLRAKLPRLDAWNNLRREAALVYDELLRDVDAVRRPDVPVGSEHVWHLYAIRVPSRDDVLARLRAIGIGAGVHYPVPIHLQPAVAEYSRGRGSLPVVEQASGQLLSLPLYPGITVDQLSQVVDAVKACLS